MVLNFGISAIYCISLGHANRTKLCNDLLQKLGVEGIHKHNLRLIFRLTPRSIQENKEKGYISFSFFLGPLLIN